jgi:hypothetical protein
MYSVQIVEQKEFDMDIESKYIYVTSFYQPASILLKLEENALFLKNLPSIAQQKKILLEIYDNKEIKIYDEVINIRRNQTRIVLPMNNPGIYFLRIYVQENLFGNYRGLLFKSDVPFYLSSSGNYRFIETIVAAPNREFLLKMPNPVSISCFQERVKITNLARLIVNNFSETYDKILAIHDWVAENIYYDFDALSHLDDRSICISKPLDVVTSRRTVCQGYTDLSIALMRSIGIPAVGVICFSLGLDSSGGWERRENLEAESNHIFPAAFCDSRWLFMDVTWDSGNEYRNGKFIKSKVPVSRKYFDITTRFLSNTHRLISLQN